MNNKKKQIARNPADAMKISAIIAIISSAVAMVFGLLFIIILLIGNFANNSTPHIRKILNNMFIFMLVFSLINIATIIVNTMLLKGKLNNSLMAGILVLIILSVTFIGIIAGILILTGKFQDQDQVNHENNEEFYN